MEQKTVQKTDEQVVEEILNHLFTNGARQQASRLLLIQEHRSGDARVSNALDLGGFSRPAVRDILRDTLAARITTTDGERG